ncbi:MULTISPECIES: acyl-CoA dehydrogenase [unclassified Marinobacterium]|uniref:acyl-CoA dehydrogenase n=1 Tax=unclassified Marinobacterium TaxID=2644139 RepID=UPI001568749D|nr:MULTISPECIES: acyl-CoA dehydrogenase [unclassified Marinobacterium]NRP53274.1 Acyl-CoA dehydrogenase [Marinobacterium sp. xm-v-242]NRP78059.1 Acyl-CoA dehydrogenase [Marinobacterium sp. xm-m-383]
MSDYQAPLKEMQFLVQNAVEKTGLNANEALADFDADTVAAILEAASELAGKSLSPMNAVGDNEGCRFEDGKVFTPTGWKEAFDQFAQDGWMGLALPMDFGGQELPKFIAQPVNEMWHSANLSFVMFHAVIQGCSEILMKFGTEEQKARYIEKFITGEWTAAMALTEPSAGTDLGELKTKAIPQDNGQYLIKGQKIYITYGEHDMTENKVHFVLARTPDAPEGSRGISLFAVPTYRINDDGSLGEFNDVVCTGIEHKTGLHGSPTCSMSYGDKDNCFGELVGPENKGLMAMFILMNEARLSVGVQGVALSQIAYQQACEYALERPQGRHFATGERRVPIAQHPDVARMLMTMKSFATGQRALGYLIAALFDQSEHATDEAEKAAAESRIALLTPIFKAFATEQANLMTGTGIQVFGGMGFVEETGVAQFMRDARITTIYEGTTGVQGSDLLFRKIRMDKGVALTQLLEEIDAVANELTANTDLAKLGQDLTAATAAVRDTLPALLAEEADLLQLNAGAVPMLDALGFLLTAWQLGEIALKATAEQSNDPEFFGNMIALAKFYNAHQLPQVYAKVANFNSAADGIADYKFDA